MGGRLGAPFNVQLDAKAALVGPRLAASIGAGIGTDLGSVALATLRTDDDDGSPLTLDVFAPVIVSQQVIPEYVSMHAVLRP